MSRAVRRPRPRTYNTRCVAKRYFLPRWVVKAIRKQAPLYGSQGRAVQVGTELLIRQKRRVKVDHRGDGAVVGMTYKLTPRTVELIEQLRAKYGKRGNVFAACVKILVE
jgi:hypothetical protein